jgi:replicative DNA helicase
MTQFPLKYGAKTYIEVLDEALKYIEARRSGRITSFKTPWSGLNNAGINGLEWGSMLTLAARPGSGKTMVASQIIREAIARNPKQQFNILEFQFEMGAKQYGSRDFAAQIAKDYNVVLSSHMPLDEFSMQMLEKYRAETRAMMSLGVNRLFLGTPMTHEMIYEAIHYYYATLPGKDGTPSGNPLIVTIDHSWLIKKNASEKEKISTLYNTVEMLMKLKNEIPVIIIMLSQLNRSIDEASRKLPGSIANYPTSGDIFGGDALMQGSDMVGILNRPAKADIRCYGPHKFKADDDDIFLHLIKVRNASNNDPLLYFKAEFNRQRMLETIPPVQLIQTNPTPGGFRTTGKTAKSPSADVGSEL